MEFHQPIQQQHNNNNNQTNITNTITVAPPKHPLLTLDQVEEVR